MTKLLIQALDMIEGGDWDAAHDIVAEDDSREVAWLHAHLHRVEGDGQNAEYWYRKADLDPFVGDVTEERYALRSALTEDPLP